MSASSKAGTEPNHMPSGVFVLRAVRNAVPVSSDPLMDSGRTDDVVK